MLGRALFDDRRDAGRQLAARLDAYGDGRTVVIGLPRGGVEVAYEIAEALEAPLDVIVALKIGAPAQPELGIGAVAPGGITLLDERLVDELGLSDEAVERASTETREEMQRRIREYRGGEEMPDLRGRTAIIVDDGLATGVTARAAIRAARNAGARGVVLAVPVCAAQTAFEMKAEVDELVCIESPERFVAVGIWYRRFGQTTDAQVIELLEEARDEVSPEDLSEL